MEQQEYLIRLQLLEQQANQFGEQLKVIDKQIEELNVLKENVEKLSDSEENEMFSELGKGIYVKGQLNKDNMLVDVGNKILVPKTSEEISSIVNKQIKKFDEVKDEIGEQVNQVNKGSHYDTCLVVLRHADRAFPIRYARCHHVYMCPVKNQSFSR